MHCNVAAKRGDSWQSVCVSTDNGLFVSFFFNSYCVQSKLKETWCCEREMEFQRQRGVGGGQGGREN